MASCASPQGVAAAQSAFEAAVVRGHHVTRDRVAHRPQAHDQRLRAGEKERTPQPVDTLTVLDLADAGVAGGERHQLGAPQIQVGRFERGQDAGLAIGSPQVRTAQREAGPNQRIVDRRAWGEEEPMRRDVKNAGRLDGRQRRLRRAGAGEQRRLRKHRLDGARLVSGGSERREIHAREAVRRDDAAPGTPVGRSPLSRHAGEHRRLAEQGIGDDQRALFARARHFQSQEIAAGRQVTDRESLDQELLLLVDERFERHQVQGAVGRDAAGASRLPAVRAAAPSPGRRACARRLADPVRDRAAPHGIARPPDRCRSPGPTRSLGRCPRAGSRRRRSAGRHAPRPRWPAFGSKRR